MDASEANFTMSIFFPVRLENTHPQRTHYTWYRSDTCTCRYTFCVKTNFVQIFPVSLDIATRDVERTTKRRRVGKKSNRKTNMTRTRKRYSIGINSAEARFRPLAAKADWQSKQEKIRWFMFGCKKKYVNLLANVGTSQTLQTEVSQRNECDTLDMLATPTKCLCIIFQYIFAPSFVSHFFFSFAFPFNLSYRIFSSWACVRVTNWNWLGWADNSVAIERTSCSVNWQNYVYYYMSTFRLQGVWTISPTALWKLRLSLCTFLQRRSLLFDSHEIVKWNCRNCRKIMRLRYRQSHE